MTGSRAAFATQGFAGSSMDVLTAQAGLTRGALYHHFGDKKGLLEAVIAQIDGEMTARLTAIVEKAATTWDGFIDESIAYMQMALEPEIFEHLFAAGARALAPPSVDEQHGFSRHRITSGDSTLAAPPRPAQPMTPGSGR